MLYMTCPTCGYFISQKIIEYETAKENICNNPSMILEQKEKEISKLLLNLKFRRYCCNARVMSYKDIVKIVLPAEVSV